MYTKMTGITIIYHYILAQAKENFFVYIKSFYNKKRPPLGDRSPIEFELETQLSEVCLVAV